MYIWHWNVPTIIYWHICFELFNFLNFIYIYFCHILVSMVLLDWHNIYNQFCYPRRKVKSSDIWIWSIHTWNCALRHSFWNVQCLFFYRFKLKLLFIATAKFGFYYLIFFRTIHFFLLFYTTISLFNSRHQISMIKKLFRLLELSAIRSHTDHQITNNQNTAINLRQMPKYSTHCKERLNILEAIIIQKKQY